MRLAAEHALNTYRRSRWVGLNVAPAVPDDLRSCAGLPAYHMIDGLVRLSAGVNVG